MDIEADFDPAKGFSQPEDPTAPVTAITVYLSQLQQLITLALKPKTMHEDIAQSVTKNFENTFVYTSEAQLLQTFLDLLEDSDIITGWNSEGYDLPYLVNRVTRVLSRDDTRRFCLWDQHPKKFSYEKYGGEQTSFKLTGRVHLDYLELYRKYTYHEMHSYSLDTVADYELQDKKVPYEGTLDQLYNTDFEKFIEYNRQDVMLIVRLDEKLRFIDLANELAHQNTVLLPTTMGAVAVTEQAIINEAHHRGLQVPNRPKRDKENTGAAGAYVAFPKKGLHKWIGSMDLNSLYPSVIRALNMAPETIIGQIRPEISDARVHEDISLKKKSFAGSWEGRFATEEYDAVMDKRKDVALTIDWEPGKQPGGNNSDILSGAEIYKLIFDSNQPWMLSSNGTIKIGRAHV